MKPGTPGFIGPRLTEAREARALTGVALAELVGVTRQAISLYEHGEQTPRPEILHRFCSVLRVPEFSFIKPIVARERSAVNFRSMSSATLMQRTRARRKLDWLFELGEHLQGFVEFPEVRLPVFEVPHDPAELSMERIDELAMLTRQAWNIGDGPIANVAALMENHGIIMGRIDLGADELDGLSAWIDDRPCVLTTSGKPAVRLRFDDTHELGHLVLHRRVDPARFSKASEFRLIENQAHRFAAAFLLPSTSFAADVLPVGLDRFNVLKTKWKTSIAMMIHRALDLDFISQDQYRRLWIAYARRGWRGHEPYDDQFQAEAPRLLDRAIRLLLKDGGQVPADLVASLARDANDLESLAGLPVGFLSDSYRDPDGLRLKDPQGRQAQAEIVSIASHRARRE